MCIRDSLGHGQRGLDPEDVLKPCIGAMCCANLVGYKDRAEQSLVEGKDIHDPRISSQSMSFIDMSNGGFWP